MKQKVLSPSSLWNAGKLLHLPTALRNEVRMSVFHHVVNAVTTAVRVVAGESRLGATCREEGPCLLLVEVSV